jgi:hypothetical protein
MLFAIKVHAQSFMQKDSLKHNTNVNLQFSPVTVVSFQKNNLPSMSFSSSYINPGFFCRQEVKLDKKLPVPFRFRLGSMQYCNWLEQKPGYKGPQQ